MNIKGKDFINLEDFTKEELHELIDLASDLKAKIKSGEQLDICKNKTLLMYFEKPSLRTRLSFETGINKLGGSALFITKAEIDPGKRESVADTARVMSKFVDALTIRTFAHEDIEEFAKWASVPVINALTDKSHPCQIMADILTIKEYFGEVKGKKLAYVGDGNNVLHSLLIGCSMFGMDISVATPEGYEAPEDAVELAKKYAAETGSKVEFYRDAKDAVKDANVIYTDTWTSMGQEAEANIRRIVFRNYQINNELTVLAAENHIVMHCLPAHKGEEIDSETFEKYSEVLFNQAENRRYAQMAVMAAIM
ncbi:MAG: ornithine carbamoyltransferase [Candidatus Gastranaerophilaceae bacterium]